MKQGIVAVLGSDGGAKAVTIRRTLSADMSSKNWLHQNGMKKTVSSQELISDSDAEEEKSPPLTDVWTSILCSRKTATGYVLPLEKQTSSGLSEKSLEICTESLGSETGSACFSPSEGGEDPEIRVLEEELKEMNQFEDPPARVSPPPIRCISDEYGSPIHMYSRRENGRLVVEAVSVPARNYLQAQRGHGRLVLSLVHAPAVNPEEEDDGVADFQEVFNDIEEAQEETDESSGDDDGEAAEEEFQFQRRSPVAMKNSIAIGRRNSTALVEEEFTIPQSLPPPPRVPRLIPPTAASFNAYDYFWRNMAGGGGGSKNKRQMEDRKSEVTVMNPYLKGCKDGRRSLLVWEPFHCIATT